MVKLKLALLVLLTQLALCKCKDWGDGPPWPQG